MITLTALLIASSPASFAASQTATIASVHPNILLLDARGDAVELSHQAISLSKSCGECHDTAWIADHSYHTSLGVDRPYPPGEAPRPWDTAAGPFGRWDPLTYRRLSAPDEDRPDALLETWVQIIGPRHVGGGPVTQVDSGAEMNCLLCHLKAPNLEARLRSIDAAAWAWQATATLEGGGVVQRTAEGWSYNEDAFRPDHTVSAAAIGLGAAKSQNCGACHGLVPPKSTQALTLSTTASATPPGHLTTGLVYSGQSMHRSGVNLQGKTELTRSWDMHAERLLECSDCHGALNDPLHGAQERANRPAHLRFDARRISLQDYLRRPQHDFATGHAAPGVLGAKFAGTMKRCEDCHDASTTHEWLPYKQRHFQAMLCESCHVPKVHAPLLQSIDWTVLTPGFGPKKTYRGVQGPVHAVQTLIDGFEPALLPTEQDGAPTKLGPHNLVTAFYWVQGDPPVPVRLADLQAAWFEGGNYAPRLIQALDEDSDAALSELELRLDTPPKLAAVKAALTAQGLSDPRVIGEIQPYGLHHQVAGRGFAVRDCASCHQDGSRLLRPTTLAGYAPAGVMPELVKDAPVKLSGSIVTGTEGLRLVPSPEASGLYVLGQSRMELIDSLGWAAVALVLLGSLLHGGARIFMTRSGAASKEQS